MNYPLVSVIIPCFNNETFVRQSIQSALAQTYPNVEVIVIDDGSSDSSLEIIKTFDEHIRWQTGPNQGAPTARNYGLRLAQGGYIKYLDADDILLVDCIERQIGQARQMPVGKKAIVYGDALWVNQDGKEMPGYQHQPKRPNEDSIAHILMQSPLTSCPLHRYEYLQEIDGFDPSIPKGQEHDLHLRLVLSGVEFVYYPGLIYKYRQHNNENRISNRRYSHTRALIQFEILQKQMRTIEMQTERPLTPIVSKVLAQRYWAYGRAVLREGYKKEATLYFETAHQLAPGECVYGNLPYPLLVKLFGPHYAETFLDELRRISRLSKSCFES